MRIEQLEYFFDVAKTKSLNVSAERLFVTQPTISEAIHKLEEELETELLIRSKKGVTLTESGEIVYRWIGIILDNVKSMREEVWEQQNHFNEALTGDLCIGATNLVSNLILPDIIEGFGKYYPNICVTNFNIRHYEISKFVERDIVDIAVFNSVETRNKNEVKNEILEKTDCNLICEEKVFAIAGKNLPISKEKVVDIDTVLQYPLVLIQSYSKEDTGIMQLIRQYNKDAKIILKTDNLNVIRQAILNERGVGLFTKSSYGKIFFSDIGDSDLVRVIKLKREIPLQYYTCLKKGKQLSMAEKAFIAYLEETAKKIK